jgi:hypothetical protein
VGHFWHLIVLQLDSLSRLLGNKHYRWMAVCRSLISAVRCSSLALPQASAQGHIGHRQITVVRRLENTAAEVDRAKLDLRCNTVDGTHLRVLTESSCSAGVQAICRDLHRCTMINQTDIQSWTRLANILHGYTRLVQYILLLPMLTIGRHVGRRKTPLGTASNALEQFVNRLWVTSAVLGIPES